MESIDVRIRTLLPELYQDSYETLQPVPMRSAGLKFAPDGRVAWDEMWGSFCDLAMAGGPPHKGALLGPGLEAEIDADFDRYDEVADEIGRGIRLVTGLRAYVSPNPGWVRVSCPGDAMADWLLRAITTENVAARRHGSMLDLPASPRFRLEKEIKNVITVTAKTCHYWVGHVPRDLLGDPAGVQLRGVPDGHQYGDGADRAAEDGAGPADRCAAVPRDVYGNRAGWGVRDGTRPA